MVNEITNYFLYLLANFELQKQITVTRHNDNYLQLVQPLLDMDRLYSGVVDEQLATVIVDLTLNHLQQSNIAQPERFQHKDVYG